MKQLDIRIEGEFTLPIQVEDAFVFPGKLRDCPEWIIDMAHDSQATVMNGRLFLHSINGTHTYDVGDLVIRHSSKHFGGIHLTWSETLKAKAKKK